MLIPMAFKEDPCVGACPAGKGAPSIPIKCRFPVGIYRQMAHYWVLGQKQNRDGSGLKLDAMYFVVVRELHVASPESHFVE